MTAWDQKFQISLAILSIEVHFAGFVFGRATRVGAREFTKSRPFIVCSGFCAKSLAETEQVYAKAIAGVEPLPFNTKVCRSG